MRPAYTALIALLLLPVCSGCLRLEETLSLRADGSGTLEMNYVVPESTMAQLKAMRALRDRLAAIQGEEAEVTDDEYTRFLVYYGSEDIEKKFKEYEKHGIRLERLRVETRQARRHVEIKAAFRDVSQLQNTALFPHHGFTLTRQSDGVYFFRRPALTAGEPTPRPSREDISTLTPILRGFYVRIQVNTPGRVVRTNAPRKSLYRAEWVFDFTQDPNAFTDFQNEEFRIAFEGKGISISPIHETPEEAAPQPD